MRSVIISRAVFAMLAVSTSVAIAQEMDNPCKPIAEACLKEGYYKGGNTEGKGLIQDCVKPVVEKQKTLSGTAFTDEMLQQCETMLKEKSKEME